MTFISLTTILERSEYWAEMNNQSNHHGTGSPEAWCPMQLHRLKVGPGHTARKSVGTSVLYEICIVAIGNPERHARKASHRGSKQQ